MYLAIDVGGTKTLLAVFDDEGKIIEEGKFATDAEYADFLKNLTENVANLTTKSFTAAAVAMPGIINRVTGVAESFGNLPWLNVHIRDDLQEQLNCPLIIENDAKAAGLAEALSLPGVRRVLYITISTGIGLGLTVDGKIDHAVSDAGGKGMLMEHDDQLMPWEDFASGKAIVAKYGQRASEIEDPAIWDQIVKTWVVGFADLIDLTSPDTIVVGGGVGSHFIKYGDKLKAELQAHKSSMLQVPPIVPAQHPEEAVVYGCYLLAKSHTPSGPQDPHDQQGHPDAAIA